jgi:hypothetical protein
MTAHAEGSNRLALGSALLVACALLLAGGAARAEFYPVNTCVGAKQKAAGKYCAGALGAAATLWTTGNPVKRDQVLARAEDRLERSWDAADAKAEADGVDCENTTLSQSAAQALVDSAAGAIVDLVGAGLDLDDPAHTACGAKLLRAAGKVCASWLAAEGRHVTRIDEDADGQVLANATSRAKLKFGRAWAQQRNTCPTQAEQGEVDAAVEGLIDDVVEQTTISPNLSATSFTRVDPPAQVEYEGRSFHAQCMNGSPYAYWVKRGSVNKLLYYFQGGGACWEQLTCSVPVCDTSVTNGDNPQNAGSGFANIDNPENPFRDWNVVFVSYCSCDIHFGDAAQDYPLHVEHRGFQNSKVVEKFAREHFVAPDEVFVTGSSAGAYGAWFHAPILQLVYPNAQFHVLADAGNGVITQEFLELYFPNWNFEANIPPKPKKVSQQIREALANGEGIPGYTEIVANAFPRANWAHYTTAFDGGSGGQTGFYNLMLNDNNPIAALSWWEGSCAFTEQMRTQALETAAAIPDNYRYYIGTGSRHTMWGSNKVYTDTTGGVPTLVDWVNAMLDSGPTVRDPEWTNVECENCGLLLPGDVRPNPLQPPFEQQGSDVVINCEASPSGAFVQ